MPSASLHQLGCVFESPSCLAGGNTRGFSWLAPTLAPSVSWSWDLELLVGRRELGAAWLRDRWEEAPSASSYGPSESGARLSAPEPALVRWTVQAEIHARAHHWLLPLRSGHSVGPTGLAPAPPLRGAVALPARAQETLLFHLRETPSASVLPPEAHFSQPTISPTSLALGLGFGGNGAMCICCCLAAKLCPTLCDPVDCSPPSSVHGILQARALEWVAIAFSRGSSQPRNRSRVSHIAGRCFTIWATRKIRQSKNPNLDNLKKFNTCQDIDCIQDSLSPFSNSKPYIIHSLIRLKEALRSYSI